jgi:hypothetical protein
VTPFNRLPLMRRIGDHRPDAALRQSEWRVAGTSGVPQREHGDQSARRRDGTDRVVAEQGHGLHVGSGVSALVNDHFASAQTTMRASMASIVGWSESRLARCRCARSMPFRRSSAASGRMRRSNTPTRFTRFKQQPAWTRAIRCHRRGLARVARLQTQWDMAREAGDRAVSLLTASTAPADVLFAHAVSAEARRENDEAPKGIGR